VHAEIEAELPYVLADRSQLSQVVMNLVTNAIEALDGEGKIELRASSQTLDAAQLANLHYNNTATPGRFAVLEVADSGPGIDREDAAHMFDPFFSTKFTGRGLGLASVLGIVQSHRGALHVQTQLGQGTCFKVALPLATALRATERPLLQRPSDPWGGSGRVLLVDDDSTVRSVVAKLITSFGFDVTDADGGERALELLREAEPPFKLVVLDWMMPGVSGSQVLKALRVLQPQLPVILISGYSAEDLAAYDECVLCVQKPMTRKQLQDAMATLLAPSSVELTA
jgi:CheY-like chemotaxis protein